uniref:Uncharacterized protein n=1 Tax=candidate division CPR3 bacterium TaxID=2268181 RepID=A0A7V3J8X2_UNCC3
MLDSIKLKLSSLNLYRVWLSFLGVLVAVFFLFFVYTISLFFIVKKAPVTGFGLNVFRAPLVGNSISGYFYREITSKFLSVFFDKEAVVNPYPDDIFPVTGELYSGRFIYAGKAEVCNNGNSAEKVCLKFKSGRVITPIFISGVSVVFFNKGPSTNERNLPLASGSQVVVFLQSDTSPNELLRNRNIVKPYFDIRELKVLN